MKTKLIIISALFAGLSIVPAFSEISVDQTTSEEYLINNGYSKAIAEHVNVAKNRATGQEYYTADEKKFQKSNCIVRFFRKLYGYTDPAAETYSLYHHNIKPTPSYTDF